MSMCQLWNLIVSPSTSFSVTILSPSAVLSQTQFFFARFICVQNVSQRSGRDTEFSALNQEDRQWGKAGQRQNRTTKWRLFKTKKGLHQAFKRGKIDCGVGKICFTLQAFMLIYDWLWVQVFLRWKNSIFCTEHVQHFKTPQLPIYFPMALPITCTPDVLPLCVEHVPKLCR